MSSPLAEPREFLDRFGDPRLHRMTIRKRMTANAQVFAHGQLRKDATALRHQRKAVLHHVMRRSPGERCAVQTDRSAPDIDDARGVLRRIARRSKIRLGLALDTIRRYLPIIDLAVELCFRAIGATDDLPLSKSI